MAHQARTFPSSSGMKQLGVFSTKMKEIVSHLLKQFLGVTGSNLQYLAKLCPEIGFHVIFLSCNKNVKAVTK